ncbi:hypothetical protein V8C40DRAFT_255452 [Trichoderma camerunense]
MSMPKNFGLSSRTTGVVITFFSLCVLSLLPRGVAGAVLQLAFSPHNHNKRVESNEAWGTAKSHTGRSLVQVPRGF